MLTRSRVTRTLLVGDEPRDIVFAGSSGARAFVTAAHRGQNRPGDPQLTTEGVGRADVWAFDATNPGDGLGGTPLAIIALFGDTPRALAGAWTDRSCTPPSSIPGTARRRCSSASCSPTAACHLRLPGATPGRAGHRTHRPIDGTRWIDELDRDWSARLAFSLPDLDVFRIDADADPAPLASERRSAASAPSSSTWRFDRRTGALFVSNTEARNTVRFEPMLRGHLTESRISVVDGTSA